MSKKIKQLYTKAGLKSPDGKGIHSKKFHRCVIDIKLKIAKGEMPEGTNPYAVCMKFIGKEKAVKKAHQK